MYFDVVPLSCCTYRIVTGLCELQSYGWALFCYQLDFKCDILTQAILLDCIFLQDAFCGTVGKTLNVTAFEATERQENLQCDGCQSHLNLTVSWFYNVLWMQLRCAFLKKVISLIVWLSQLHLLFGQLCSQFFHSPEHCVSVLCGI